MGSRKKCIITTYHKSLSYGGCLQAFATQLLLESMGYDAVFLDYENAYEARRKTNAYLSLGSHKEIVKTLIKRFIYRGSSYQRFAFSDFHKMLPKTKRSYTDISEMDDIDACVLIVASDQVWNPEITNGVEPVFFLAFGNENARRLSFASSMGSHEVTSEEKILFKRYLAHFDAISVREEFARKQIGDLVSTPVTLCMDPTLQISNSDWEKREVRVDNIHPGSFIFLFIVSSDESRYTPIIRKLKKQLHMPVVMCRLNSRKPQGVDRVIPATPFEFLYLVHRAALVLTDSFHGAAFSINFNTPFYVLPNRKNNVRLEELLRQTGLSERFLSNDKLPSMIDCDINWECANSTISLRRDMDKRWLSAMLAGEQA